MAQPAVFWYTADNSSQVTQWDIGTVDAGSASTPKEILIWNNRGGGTAVSDMTATTITTKDSAGGNTGELVVNTWIECKVISKSEAQHFPMGGTSVRDLKASDASVANGIIRGGANDGSLSATTNFCHISLRANVPPTATAGLVNFLSRVSYQYT
jgi:hypothetical protein